MKYTIFFFIVWIAFLFVTAYVFGDRCYGIVDQPIVPLFVASFSFVLLFAHLLDMFNDITE